MTLDEVIVVAKSLPRADRIRLVDAMNEEALAEQDLTPEQRQLVKDLQGVKEIPIWSTYNSFEAAAAIQRLLEEKQNPQ